MDHAISASAVVFLLSCLTYLICFYNDGNHFKKTEPVPNQYSKPNQCKGKNTDEKCSLSDFVTDDPDRSLGSAVSWDDARGEGACTEIGGGPGESQPIGPLKMAGVVVFVLLGLVELALVGYVLTRCVASCI